MSRGARKVVAFALFFAHFQSEAIPRIPIISAYTYCLDPWIQYSTPHRVRRVGSCRRAVICMRYILACTNTRGEARRQAKRSYWGCKMAVSYVVPIGSVFCPSVRGCCICDSKIIERGSQVKQGHVASHMQGLGDIKYDWSSKKSSTSVPKNIPGEGDSDCSPVGSRPSD